MCDFITLVVGGSGRSAITPLVARHGRNAKPAFNPAIAALLKPTEAQFLTTVGNCDCGTVLRGHAPAAPDWRSGQAAKLARQGWSPAKIERWFADREGADTRAKERSHARSFDSVDLWRDLIGDLLASPGVEQAGLLLHAYSGDVNDEEFAAYRTSVAFADFATRLQALNDGELLMTERAVRASR
jgi:hypothetical protein